MRSLAACLLAGGLALTAVACDGEATPPDPLRTIKTAKLTFGVVGNKAEVAAYDEAVAGYNARTDESDVSLRSYPDEAALVADELDAGADGSAAPDVFLVSREDVATLQQAEAIQPVDQMLDERGVDLGDDYARDALEAFSSDLHLQCMPFALSPMVVYYNTELVDFTKMLARGLDAPELTPGEPAPRWSFDQFTAAADFAARPRKGTKGVYVDPTLAGLAPFVYSGGGQLFDDQSDPTSLTLSDSGSRDALQRTLALLQDPALTLSPQQLSRKSGLQWFEDGRLGMITGSRSLVPQLRAVKGLRFDTMPMPVLDSAATTGDITGICVSAGTGDAGESADFLVQMISAETGGLVAKAGYLVPANQQVALSDQFLQPTQQPAHADAFNTGIRSLRIGPFLSDAVALSEAVDPDLAALVASRPSADPSAEIEAATEAIDAASREVLDPGASASPSP